MQIQKIIPQETVPFVVTNITFNIEAKMAYVSIKRGTNINYVVPINCVPILQAGTDSQRAVIRGFFKSILAQALNVTVAEIPEIMMY